jgi:hypothetical protein
VGWFRRRRRFRSDSAKLNRNRREQPCRIHCGGVPRQRISNPNRHTLIRIIWGTPSRRCSPTCRIRCRSRTSITRRHTRAISSRHDCRVRWSISETGEQNEPRERGSSRGVVTATAGPSGHGGYFLMSKRSFSATLTHALTKSLTNFSLLSSWAYTSAMARNTEFDPNTRSLAVAVHFGEPVTRSLPS